MSTFAYYYAHIPIPPYFQIAGGRKGARQIFGLKKAFICVQYRLSDYFFLSNVHVNIFISIHPILGKLWLLCGVGGMEASSITITAWCGGLFDGQGPT